jgi:chemotaxis response regulator CheB
MPVRTLIVDDERMARKRLRTLLTADAEVDVVGECTNGRDAVTAIREREPDLVFLDVQLPELDGFAVVQTIGVQRMPVTVFVTHSTSTRSGRSTPTRWIISPSHSTRAPPPHSAGRRIRCDSARWRQVRRGAWLSASDTD